MVDIFIGAAIPPVQNSPNKRDNSRRKELKKKEKAIKERRRNKEDRRQDIRSGVVVTLSTYPDRRRSVDRRKP